MIDTSSLLRAKQVVPPSRQWTLFKKLEEMVFDGSLCFPRQVRDELSGGRYTDTPEAWALAVCSEVKYAYDPEPSHVQEVLAVSPNLVDADAERDRADPFVLAQATELIKYGRSVCVVTDDVLDRLPIKIALRTACERMNVPNCTLQDFLIQIGWS